MDIFLFDQQVGRPSESGDATDSQRDLLRTENGRRHLESLLAWFDEIKQSACLTLSLHNIENERMGELLLALANVTDSTKSPSRVAITANQLNSETIEEIHASGVETILLMERVGDNSTAITTIEAIAKDELNSSQLEWHIWMPQDGDTQALKRAIAYRAAKFKLAHLEIAPFDLTQTPSPIPALHSAFDEFEMQSLPCSAYEHTLTLDTEGNVYPCPSFLSGKNEAAIANVFDSPWEDIFRIRGDKRKCVGAWPTCVACGSWARDIWPDERAEIIENIMAEGVLDTPTVNADHLPPAMKTFDLTTLSEEDREEELGQFKNRLSEWATKLEQLDSPKD